jgi:uncharacterized membrane protein
LLGRVVAKIAHSFGASCSQCFSASTFAFFTTTIVVGRLVGVCSTARVVAAVIIINIVVIVVRTIERYIAGDRDINE